MRPNPFKYARIVTGNDFCPRLELEHSLGSLIASGQSVLVEGERRVGKTSLIVNVLNTRKMKPLYVDIFHIKTLEEFCARFVKGIASMDRSEGFMKRILKRLWTLRPVISADPLTGQPTISIEQSSRLLPESIEGLLDFVQDLAVKQRFAVVFDEFQDVLQIPDSLQIQAVLRSKIQFHEGISYVFSGSVRHHMLEIFSDPRSPFFKSAATVSVGPLQFAVFSSFLAKRFELGKRAVSDQVMATIFKYAGDMPGDVQQLCATIWECTTPNSRIDEETIREALKLIFAREAKGYDLAMEAVTGIQKKCLLTLAQNPNVNAYSARFLQDSGVKTTPTVAKSLKSLEKKHILYMHEKKYKFANPFFKWWLITHQT